MSSIKGGFGSFLLRRSAPKSVRQRHQTGPQYYKRKSFNFQRGTHQLHRRVAPALMTSASPTQQIEHKRYSHLPGDARLRPTEDFTFQRSEEKRVDKAMYAWAKQGSLQLHQIGGKKETFVCYRCGYPVKSALVAIKDDNWDWRMCYNCYTRVRADGMERNT